jgi:hypothetical protein
MPKFLRLRSTKDGLGNPVEVEVHFSARPDTGVLGRMSEVADAVRLAGTRKDQNHAAALVCGLEADFGAGHVTVRACVPETVAAEDIQRELLSLIPATQAVRQ